MELRIVKHGLASAASEVETIHGGKSFVWNLIGQVLQDGFDAFDHINRYWASLPHEAQSNIFNVYERIHDAFQRFYDESLAMTLRPLIAELFFLHPQENVQLWVQLKSDVLIPSSIKSKFDPTAGMAGTPERTYLTEDYKKLVPLAITMRIMIPIWGEFISRSRKDLGTVFKEYQAFQLLANSPVLRCEAMERLRTFVEHTISREHSLDSAIIYGISSEDFPLWVMAHAVVRRLCYADVRGLDQKGSSIVTYLYNFIDQKVSTLDSQMGTVKDKRNLESAGEGENNLSKLEGFKIKQAVPIGDISIINQYIRMSMRTVLKPKKQQPQFNLFQFQDYPTKPTLIQRLSADPEFPAIVKQAYGAASHLMNEALTHPQVTIAGWVLSEYIPIRALPYMQKVDVISMIALAQAYLWHHKHYDLAILVAAIPRLNVGTEVNIISDSKLRTPKTVTEEISTQYPYLKRTNSRAKNVKMFSATLTSIDNITDALSRYTWTSTLPVAWNPGPDFVHGARYTLPSDIREKIGRLILEINVNLEKSFDASSNNVSNTI